MSAQSFTPHEVMANVASDESHYPPDNDPLVSCMFTAKIEEFNMGWNQATPLQRQDIEWVSCMINRLMGDFQAEVDEGMKVAVARNFWKICCQIDGDGPEFQRTWLQDDMTIMLDHGIAIIRPSATGTRRAQNFWSQLPKEGLPPPPPFLRNVPRYGPSRSMASQPLRHMQSQQPVQHQQPLMNHRKTQQDGNQGEGNAKPGATDETST